MQASREINEILRNVYNSERRRVWAQYDIRYLARWHHMTEAN